MAETAPQFRTRRRAVVNLYNGLPPEQKAVFDLLDWYWLDGPGVGAPPQSRPAFPVADHLGITEESLHTLWWKTRADADLARLDDLATTAGMYDLQGQARDAQKWATFIAWLDELP